MEGIAIVVIIGLVVWLVFMFLIDGGIWKLGLRKRIAKNITLPKGWYLTDLSLFTAKRLPDKRLCKIYTEYLHVNGSWTNEYAIYEIKTGKKLTKKAIKRWG